MSDTSLSTAATPAVQEPKPEKPKRVRDHKAERRRKLELRAAKGRRGSKPKAKPPAKAKPKSRKATPKRNPPKRRAPAKAPRRAAGERSWPTRYHRWVIPEGAHHEEKCSRPDCKVRRIFYMGTNSIKTNNPQIWFRLADGKEVRKAPPCVALPADKAGRA